MKIAILGFSGSGKSTLARKLGTRFSAPVLHMDCIHWLPDWQERPREEERALLTSFLDENTDWVIDGNYSGVCLARRLQEADLILLLKLPRLSCLFRVLKRYRTYRGRTRASIGEGCPEKVDREFLFWVVWGGRTRKTRDRHRAILAEYGEKVRIIRNQRGLLRLEAEYGLPHGAILED